MPCILAYHGGGCGLRVLVYSMGSSGNKMKYHGIWASVLWVFFFFLLQNIHLACFGTLPFVRSVPIEAGLELPFNTLCSEWSVFKAPPWHLLSSWFPLDLSCHRSKIPESDHRWLPWDSVQLPGSDLLSASVRLRELELHCGLCEPMGSDELGWVSSLWTVGPSFPGRCGISLMVRWSTQLHSGKRWTPWRGGWQSSRSAIPQRSRRWQGRRGKGWRGKHVQNVLHSVVCEKRSCSVCSPDRPQSWSPPALASKCRDYRHVPPHLTHIFS